MKHGISVLLFSLFLVQGFAQIHITQTRVKWKKSRGVRMIKSIICDTEGDNDALFRNWRKRPGDRDEWWLKFGDYRGGIMYEESDGQAFWQIDIGQTQVTAVQAFSPTGELRGWRLSNRSDTLVLGNFQPDAVNRRLLSCALGKAFVPEGQEEDTGFSLQKMLTFTQRQRGEADLDVFESYSADRCPTEFRIVAAFLASWVLARELGQ